MMTSGFELENLNIILNRKREVRKSWYKLIYDEFDHPPVAKHAFHCMPTKMLLLHDLTFSSPCKFIVGNWISLRDRGLLPLFIDLLAP